MFEYVAKEEVVGYKAYCSDVLNRLKMELEKEYDIETCVTLIGSGAKNMVMRNGRGAFNLDFSFMGEYSSISYLLKIYQLEKRQDSYDRRISRWSKIMKGEKRIYF